MPETMVFYCEYAFDQDKRRDELESALSAKGGGLLGIKGIWGIEISYSDHFVRDNWEKLLTLTGQPDILEVGDGILIKLIKSDRTLVPSLTFRVISLEYVEVSLSDMGTGSRREGEMILTELDEIPGLKVFITE